MLNKPFCLVISDNRRNSLMSNDILSFRFQLVFIASWFSSVVVVTLLEKYLRSKTMSYRMLISLFMIVKFELLHLSFTIVNVMFFEHGGPP